MKVLIAPWGNPFGWKEVEYVYNGQKEKSKDPLILIRKIENPDKVIIVSVDTLADDYVYSFKNSSWDDIKTCAENSILNFSQKELGFIPDKIIISYGFGEFNNTKFIGNAIDFYYSTFKEFAFYFAELLQQINREIEVIFDATHGMNWTTILTYRALREIFEIFAYGYDVKLKVLNSDPYTYIGREVKIDRLNINVIEESKILPRISVYRSDKRPVEPCFLLENKSKEEIGKDIENFFETSFNTDEILIFLGSFLYALPVFILSHMIDSSALKEKIEKISEEFEKNICSKNLSKLEIFRNWEFRENFANLVKAYLVSSILEKIGFKKLSDIPLSKIEDLKNKVYKNFPIESNRIDKELGDIKGLQNITQQYEVYNKIKGNTVSNQDQVDKRNFFAHAGFEHNVIELKKENEEIYIRIYAGNKNSAEELIIENLPQI